MILMRLKTFFIMLTLLSGLSLLTFVRSAEAKALPKKESKCPSIQSDEYTLRGFNPAVHELSPGISLPGNFNQRVLYRGIYHSNRQFDFSKVLAGLFGENGWYIGSPMFWGITQVLTGDKSLDHDFLPSGNLPLKMREYFEIRQILKPIEELLNCKAPQHYKIQEAEALAAVLMNKVFFHFSKNIEKTYLNIADPNYYERSYQQLGLANNAVDFIIASNYDQVASLYGNKILVLKDKRTRGVDLGYWNYVHNQAFFSWWVDNGEIDIPGYVTSEEVLGFQQRKKDRDPSKAWGKDLPNSPIDFAVYGIEMGGEKLALLLDGQDQLCIAQGSDQKYYPCKDYWSDKNILKAPVPFPEVLEQKKQSRMPLIGVITTCQEAVCPAADKVIAWYNKNSERSAGEEMIKKIEALSINGKKLRLYKKSENVEVAQ